MKTGYTTGTGAVLAVDIGFKPSLVELQVSESSAIGYWSEDMRVGTFVAEHVAELRAGDILIGRHLPSMGSTNTQLANYRVTAQYNGAGDVRVECTATAAGTAFTASTHDVTAACWGCFQLCVTTGSGYTIVPDSSLANTTEAAAIANMGTKTTNSASLGYITIEATSGAIWDATTDALEGGSGGTPAETTNYYEGYAVMSNGITPIGAGDESTLIANSINTYMRGFLIGTDALLNVAGSIITYKAYKD